MGESFRKLYYDFSTPLFTVGWDQKLESYIQKLWRRNRTTYEHLKTFIGNSLIFWSENEDSSGPEDDFVILIDLFNVFNIKISLISCLLYYS